MVRDEAAGVRDEAAGGDVTLGSTASAGGGAFASAVSWPPGACNAPDSFAAGASGASTGARGTTADGAPDSGGGSGAAKGSSAPCTEGGGNAVGAASAVEIVDIGVSASNIHSDPGESAAAALAVALVEAWARAACVTSGAAFAGDGEGPFAASIGPSFFDLGASRTASDAESILLGLWAEAAEPTGGVLSTATGESDGRYPIRNFTRCKR